MNPAIIIFVACAALSFPAAANATAGLSSQLPCATADGDPITYEIEGLGTLAVAATSLVRNHPQNISVEIAQRQRGEDRPFAWDESFFDIFVGSYESNPSHRNWAGSDLSGGSHIAPGGIGNVNIPCVDRIDCISKKHDIEYWLAVNFRATCQVTIHIRITSLNFTVTDLDTVNFEAVGEVFGLASSEERQLFDAISR